MTLSPNPNARRYDIDWLRTLAFGILIFYHIGMMYVSWGWHIKSEAITPMVENLMILVNPWRLVLLFLISGIGLSFALKRLSLGAAFKNRTVRLMIPLLFGMLVIIPPQLYFEVLQKGRIEVGYIAFLERFFGGDATLGVPIPNYNHLWFVAYLWLYVMVLIPLMAVLRSPGVAKFITGMLGRTPAMMVFLVPTILLAIYDMTLSIDYPVTHDFRTDPYNHARYFTVFFLGYLAGRNDNIWHQLTRMRRGALAYVLAFWVFHIAIRMVVDLDNIPTAITMLLQTLYQFNIWAAIVAILGYGRKYLNHPSRILSYLNDCIFPYYILHQTITIIAGYYLVEMNMPGAVEFILLTIATIGGIGAITHYVIRPFNLIRPLFGMKQRQQPSGHVAPVAAE